MWCKIRLFFLIFFYFSSAGFAAEYDVVIAGGGVGGITAAIQAARGGARVAVFEPSSWIGGQMSAAGVSTMDDLSRQRSGIYLEFVNRVNDYYAQRGKSTGTAYWDNRSMALEPHVGQKILYEMIDATKKQKIAGKPSVLDVFLNSSVVEVKREKNKITGIVAGINAGRKTQKLEIPCKILIDATEYGDMMPLARVGYRAGNSATPFIKLDNSMIQDITWTAVIKFYPGGLPQGLQAPSPLKDYDAAKQNYEAHVTQKGFDFKGVFPIETPVNFVSHNAYRAVPNSGTFANYDGSKENWRFISKTGVNWGNDYPGKAGWISGKSGLPARYLDDMKFRKNANKEAFFKTLHFIYYMQTELDPLWSVADDEYYTENLPPEILADLPSGWLEIAKRLPVIPYVREGRRIIGERTLTSSEILKNSLSYRDGLTSAEFFNAIAIGGYPLDLHNACTDGDLEWEFNETDKSMYSNRPRGAFQVPLDILIPKDVDGFIAAEKNLSMSRLSAGAIRLQPISMMTGQAAGALAALSVSLGLEPRNVPAIAVQKVLVRHGVSISLCKYSDVPPEHPMFGTVQISNLYGLIDPVEYPHVPSYNITDLDDPKLAMAIIKGADKGIFGIEEMMTNSQIEQAVKRASKFFGIDTEKLPKIKSPDRFATKAIFADYMISAFGEKITTGKSVQHFSDIPENHPAFASTSALVELGVIRVEKDKKFHPAKPVVRGEMVEILTDMMRAVSVSTPASFSNTPPARK